MKSGEESATSADAIGIRGVTPEQPFGFGVNSLTVFDRSPRAFPTDPRYDCEMGRVVFRAALMAGAALALIGCGLADSHSALPEFMRAKALDPPPPEPLPDVAQIVRAGLDAIFVPTSNPQRVRVSPPWRDLRGPGYNACVRADLTSAIGKPLVEESYRITIAGGTIIDRRRAEPEDNCSTETYQPI